MFLCKNWSGFVVGTNQIDAIMTNDSVKVRCDISLVHNRVFGEGYIWWRGWAMKAYTMIPVFGDWDQDPSGYGSPIFDRFTGFNFYGGPWVPCDKVHLFNGQVCCTMCEGVCKRCRELRGWIARQDMHFIKTAQKRNVKILRDWFLDNAPAPIKVWRWNPDCLIKTEEKAANLAAENH